ncbi:diaminopimelate epimerase [Rossellomorea aquimaris]|uniref:Diaminopimelate epimerase n=1 Tax=Rossellomorea aquimaris TaxID=189382 RepID=A0A1J6VTJ9_9BACI|nr:diaminopimelate epimerase [Rossellomorea aquimaris]OIU68605.1 diaminopimelate epimerase [Rossellomorea aquimaris]
MKQGVDFIKFNPTENMTVLVKSMHNKEDHARIAEKLMSYDCVHAEQVGFIKLSEQEGMVSSLRMAGGEFCGNACMSLAAYIASVNGLPEGKGINVAMEASGTGELVRCRVKREVDRYHCKLSMPLPSAIGKNQRDDFAHFSMAMIQYEEAVHIVIEVDEINSGVRVQAEEMARIIGSGYEGKLVGVLVYIPHTEELAPLIYVPEIGSMIWERGCGSGTASLAAYLAWKKREIISALVKQPGGVMKAACEWEKGSIRAIEIEGTVGIVAEGKAYIG